ncbi:MAG: LysR family transcriptional regulator [Burkholderiaceae bacterium]|nr:LysR family transcriptional regulator [Burkholderiaceae bacterium]
MTAISQSFRCFDEVARRGSVRKAAETLHLTAAAVNQQILNLEASVGMPLFDRVPRGMQLTSAGEIMVAAVRRSQRDFDSALSQVEDLRQLRRGHVNVGVPHSTAEYPLPQVIEGVLKTHPGLTFSVHSGTGEQLLQWVAGGEIDVAYCLRRPPPPGVEEGRALSQHLGVVMAPDHPLNTGGKLLRLRDCLQYPLVLMSPGMELRSMLDRIDPRLARAGRPMVETSSVPMVRQLVGTGRALGFLLPDHVAHDVESGVLAWVGLEDPGARLHSCIYQRAGHTTSVAMGLFLEALHAAVDGISARFGHRSALRSQSLVT